MPTNMSIDSDASDLGRGANHGADDASQLDTTSPSTDFAGDSTSGQLDGLSASGGANQSSKRERFDDTGFSTRVSMLESNARKLKVRFLLRSSRHRPSLLTQLIL